MGGVLVGDDVLVMVVGADDWPNHHQDQTIWWRCTTEDRPTHTQVSVGGGGVVAHTESLE